jgi:hypothetical protein
VGEHGEELVLAAIGVAQGLFAGGVFPMWTYPERSRTPGIDRSSARCPPRPISRKPSGSVLGLPSTLRRRRLWQGGVTNPGSAAMEG